MRLKQQISHLGLIKKRSVFEKKPAYCCSLFTLHLLLILMMVGELEAMVFNDIVLQGRDTITTNDSIKSFPLKDGDIRTLQDINTLNQIYQSALASDNIEKQIVILIQIGKIQFNEQSYDKSLVSFEKAAELATLSENKSLLAEIYFRLGQGYEYTHQLKKSVATYEACYDVAKAQDNLIILTRLDRKTGHLLQLEGDTLKALMHYETSATRLTLQSKEQRQEYIDAWYEYYDLALVYYGESNKETEITHICDQIEETLQEIEKYDTDATSKSFFKSLQTRCHLYNSDKLDVFPTISEINQYSPNVNIFESQLNTFTRLALKKNKIKQAKIYNQASRKLAKQGQNIPLSIQSLQLKKEIALLDNDYQSAYLAAEKIRDLEKILLSKERIVYTKRVQKAIEEKKKEERIIHLNSSKQALESNNQLLIMGLTAMLLLTIIALYFYYKTVVKNKIISKQRDEIIQKNEKLAQINIAKDRIFSIIGHDLRKPAISFRNLSKKINYLIERQEYKRLLKLGIETEKETRAFGHLTDNLLSWALQQKNMMPYNPTNANLNEICSELLDFFERPARGKNVDLYTKMDEYFTVFTDVNVLNTIFRNLIDNAIKFTPAGGQIHFLARRKNQKIIVEIKDNGIGMFKKQAQNIFSLKKNKSHQGTAGEPGTGLGLHLVKELADLNQCHIYVNSQKNKGTSFFVEIPTIKES